MPKCAYRPVVFMLQARGSIGLQADRAGYVVLTVVDTVDNAVSVLLNAEELGLLADEIGGVR